MEEEGIGIGKGKADAKAGLCTCKHNPESILYLDKTRMSRYEIMILNQTQKKGYLLEEAVGVSKHSMLGKFYTYPMRLPFIGR